MIKNLKKVISTFAAVAILATSASAFAVTFPDVDESASYANAVEALTTLGIVDGDDNGLFNPDNTVTRAEFTKMVVEAIGEGASAAASTWTKFADAQTHWAAGYIETGVAKGFINGYDDTTFGPDDKVTYAQAVKMLVAAIGYELWASEQGGYPSGYLAWGSQLDIIKGVTGVTNDTALTRAQCATLIYNTLQAPICRINGYDKDWQGNWYPKYEQMDGTYGIWESLLTEEHDAYAVKGRVMSADKLRNEVKFTVEASEDFDDVKYDGNTTTPTVKVGTTDAANMQFIYAEAIIQEDEDTNEYTMVSITPYGKSETVTFAAADVKQFNNADGKIEVRREGSAKTIDYKFRPSEAALYVNGTRVADKYAPDPVATPAPSATPAPTGAPVLSAYAWDANFATYFKGNIRGEVTLIDATETASTSTDGVYDYIVVTYYVAAQVNNVKITDEKVKITTDGASAYKTLEYSLIGEKNKNVVYFKDGAVIEASDVKEDDIVLFAYDVADGGTLDDSDWADVYVSDKTVTGTATGRSNYGDSRDYLIVDGEKYKFDDYSDVASANLQTEYTLFLDAMGYAYDYEEGTSSKNLGVVVAVKWDDQDMDEAPEVTIITRDGSVKTYVAKSEAEAETIADAVGVTVDSDGAFETAEKVSKPTAAATYADRVIGYRVNSSNKISFVADYAKNGDEGIEYRESTSKLGNYTIDDAATTILDLSSYLSNGTVGKVTSADFENEQPYDAWMFDNNVKTGIYNFGIVTNGMTNLRPTSALAVVKASGTTTNAEDGTPVQVLTVVKGDEEVEVLYEVTTTVPEGAVVMYKVGNDGYVEKGDLKVIVTPDTTYAKAIGDILAETTGYYTEVVETALLNNDTTAGKYTLDIDGEDADVEVFYGPVYSINDNVINLFATSTAGASSNVSTDVESFRISDANVYTVSYDVIGEKVGAGVEAGSVSAKTSMYKDMYTDSTMSSIDWSKVSTAVTDEDIAPVIAFVRTDKESATDVVLYVAE